MEQNTPQKKTRRVTHKQLQRRRTGALFALLIVIFLLSASCSSCIRCACKPSSSALTADTGTTTAAESGSMTTAPIQTTVTTTTTTLPQEYLVSTLPDSYQISVTALTQYPELPTGNEITSLTMVLNFLGFNITKENLANNFLTCAQRGTATFSQAFIGSPFNSDGLGCFAPVIVDTAQKYLNSVNSGRYVKSLNANDFEDLLWEVASNHPVLVWVSQDLEPIEEEYCFTIYGKAAESGIVTTAPAEASEAASETSTQEQTKTDVYWITNATCVVLTGYDLANQTVTVNDPTQGEITYNMGMFKTSYNALYKQAVIIY